MINRKKLITAFMCGTMIAGIMSINAIGAQKSAKICPDFHIIIDGKECSFFSADGEEVYPIVYNGYTYLPLRAIGELMGRNVNWDQSSLTITLSGNRKASSTAKSSQKTGKQQDISVQIRDDFKIVVDGENRSFTDDNSNAVYPLLYNGSTYLPLRSIGELMGKSIDWNDSTKTVTMGSEILVTDADSFNESTPDNKQKPSDKIISVEDAKAKALEHAGISKEQATFTKQKLDWDNGLRIYEVEFYTVDNMEYDYEIDAYSGNVIKYEHDSNYYYNDDNCYYDDDCYYNDYHYNRGHYGSNTSSVDRFIGMEAAKKIALAKVPGATAANINEFELDYDDGKAKYEGEIKYDRREYEFEIDASTGAILKWEIDD